MGKAKLQKKGSADTVLFKSCCSDRSPRLTLELEGEFSPMSHSSSSAEALEERIGSLIRFAEKLRAEKKELEDRNEELARKLSEQEQWIGELEKKVEELGRPGAGDSSSTQRKEAEKRIDGMIREIDRCIALLER